MSLIENSLENVLKNDSIDSSKLISKLVKVKQDKYERWIPTRHLNSESLSQNTKIVLNISDALIKNEALLAGGSVLSAFSDFKVHDLDIYVNRKNAMNIYKDLFKIGYDNEPSQQIICPAYDQSFFKKNHILCRFRLINRDFMPIDLMIVPDNISLISVVTNFDLSFCEIWFDGQNVYAIDPVGIENKEGRLKPDYTEALFKHFNKFIHNRIKKYSSRGFKISYSSSGCYFLYDHSEIKTINDPNGSTKLPGDNSDKDIYPEEWVVKLVLSKFYKINCKRNFSLYYYFTLKEFTWQELFSMLKRYYHITPLSYGLYTYISSTLDSIVMPSEYLWTNSENPSVQEDASPEFKKKRVDIKVKLLIKYLILTTFGAIYDVPELDNEKYHKWAEYINIVLNSDIRNEEYITNGENFYINFSDDILSSQQNKLLTDILYIENIKDPTHYREMIPNEEAEDEIIIVEGDKNLEYRIYKNILNNYFSTINQRSNISYYKNNYLIPDDFIIFNIEIYDNISLNEWLEEDSSNLIFLYNSSQSDAVNGIKGIGLTKYSLKYSLYHLYTNLIVECKKSGNILGITRDDVIIDKIYHKLPIGDSYNNGILLSKLNCVKDELEKELGNRIFYLTEERLLKSISSLSNVIFYPELSPKLNIYGSIISAVASSHCDEGQQTYVYDNIFIIDKSKLVNRTKFDDIIGSGLIPIEETNTDINKYEEISSKIADFISNIEEEGVGESKEKVNIALINASRDGQLDIVNSLIAEEADINLKDNEGKTALMHAARNENLDIVNALITAGADLDLHDDYGKTALMHAARNENLDIVNVLIAAEADINLQDNEGKTALMHAARNENLDIVNALITAGADLDLHDDYGYTALIHAALYDHLDIVNALIAAEPDINLKNNEGYTALMYAARNENLDIVNALIAAEPDINLKDNEGETALICAARNGHIDVVNALIAAGADLNSQDIDGDTALICAVRNGHTDVVNALIAAGANPIIRNTNGNTAEEIVYTILDQEEGEESYIRNESILRNLQDYVNYFDQAENHENEQTPLMEAVNTNNIDIVRELIAADVDLNLQNGDGDTALIIASENHYTEIANVLIAAGADVNLQNHNQETPLMMACSDGNINLVNALIAAGADLNLKDINEYTALTRAIGRSIDVVNALIAGGADINLQDGDGDTPLMVASSLGDIETLNALIAADAVINLQNNKNGNTALIYAAKYGDIDLVNALITADADLNLQNVDGETALNLAAKHGHKDVVNALIAAGADLNLQNVNGNSAIIYSARTDNIETLNALIAAGADINLQNNKGNTALISASGRGYIDLVNALITADADLNLQNVDGETALINAVIYLYTDIVNVLIAAGADLNLQNGDGDTALNAVAKDARYTEIVNVLIAAGADINLQNDEGNTALIVASQHGRTEIVNALIAAGADLNLQNGDRDTALIKAVKFRYTEIVNALIAAGADLNLQCGNGDTALIIASRYSYYIEIVNALIAAGADLNLQNQEENTALIYAAMYGHTEIVNVLIAAGADPHIKNTYGNTAIQCIESVIEDMNNSDEVNSDEFHQEINTYNSIIEALENYIARLEEQDNSDSGDSYYDGMYIDEIM